MARTPKPTSPIFAWLKHPRRAGCYWPGSSTEADQGPANHQHHASYFPIVRQGARPGHGSYQARATGKHKRQCDRVRRGNWDEWASRIHDRYEQASHDIEIRRKSMLSKSPLVNHAHHFLYILTSAYAAEQADCRSGTPAGIYLDRIITALSLLVGCDCQSVTDNADCQSGTVL